MSMLASPLTSILIFNTYDSVAGFIAEPLLGEGGIITPPDDYFLEIEKILKKHEILLLVDEVQTGFGRKGKMFGIEHYGVEPDIMMMAKGIVELGLAPLVVENVFQPIKVLHNEGGVTIRLVEQNVRKSLEIAERGYVLKHGRIVRSGETSTLLADENIKKAYLGI